MNKQYMNKVRRLAYTVLEIVFLLFVILDCNTVYAMTLNIDLHIPEITAFLAILLTLVELLSSKVSRSLLYNFAKFIILYYIIILLYMLIRVRKDVIFGYVARFVVFLPAITLLLTVKSWNGELYTFIFKYSKIMSFLAFTSIFFWIFRSQLHLISPSGSIRVGWGGDYLYPTCYGLYVERQGGSFLFYNGYRNQGIFCEGPMFSLCLALAIAIEFFFPKDSIDNLRFSFRLRRKRISFNGRKDRTRVVVLVLAMLTTVTTTGYILLIMMLVMQFILSKPRRVAVKIVKLLSVGFLVILGGAAALWIFYRKSTSGSWAVRVDDYNAGFKAWLASPLFGSGYADSSAVKSYMSSFRISDLGFSNSIFQVLSQGGLLLFSVYLVGMVGGLIKVLKAKRYGFVAFDVVLILEFIFTIFGFNFLMLFMLAFEYTILISHQHNVNKPYVLVNIGREVLD